MSPSVKWMGWRATEGNSVHSSKLGSGIGPSCWMELMIKGSNGFCDGPDRELLPRPQEVLMKRRSRAALKSSRPQGWL